MLCRVMFAGVVGSIEATFGPKDFEESLGSTAFEPLETHVIGFRCF